MHAHARLQPFASYSEDLRSVPGRTELETLTNNREDPLIRSSASVLKPAHILGWSCNKVYFTHVSTEILLKCVRFCLMTNSFSAVITRNLIITMSKLSDFRQIFELSMKTNFT